MGPAVGVRDAHPPVAPSELSDYYNYDYSDAKATHYSVRLTDDDRQEIQGYMSRSTPEATALHDTLKDGKKHRVMVTLEVAEDAGAGDLKRIGHVGGRKSWERAERETAVGGGGVHAVQEHDVQVRNIKPEPRSSS